MDDRTRRPARFLFSRDGATAVEFAYIMPVLVVLTLGLIEVALIVFDYHRAGEAMRAAVRAFEIGAAVTSYTAADLPIACPGNAACDTARIDAVITQIQATFPEISATNLQVDYVASGLDVDAAASVVNPVITVSIVGLQHNFFILSTLVPGIPDNFTLPTFTSSRVVQSDY